jgi:ribosomal-protein-alanine N-acetyltransferase
MSHHLTLQTERLLLRPLEKGDAGMMYALNEDMEVLQYTGDTQFESVAAVEEFLEQYDQYEKYGTGRMVVILKGTGEILGWCGLKYHPDTKEYDIGYRFFKKHWRKGYATESAAASMEYGLRTLGLNQIVGHARKENAASIRIFEKINMAFLEQYMEDGNDWVKYAFTHQP